MKKSIVKSGVYDYKESNKALKFYKKWKKKKFKVFDAGSGSDTWALFAIKRGGKKELVDEEFMGIETENDLEEITSEEVFK